MPKQQMLGTKKSIPNRDAFYIGFLYYLLIYFVARVLFPVGVALHHASANWEDTTEQLEFSIWAATFCIVLITPVVFKHAEADKVVATPELTAEFAATLVDNVFQCESANKLWSHCARANLVERL